MNIEISNINIELPPTMELPINVKQAADWADGVENTTVNNLYSFQMMAVRAVITTFCKITYDYKIIREPIIDQATLYQVRCMDMIEDNGMVCGTYKVELSYPTLLRTTISYEDVRHVADFETEDELINFCIFCKLTDYLPISANLERLYI